MRFINSQGKLFGIINLIDAFVLLFLLSLAPLGYYAYRSVMGWGPLIVHTMPQMLDARKGGTLVIVGKNFQEQSIVKVGDFQASHVIFNSTRRLEVSIPPHKNRKPGQYDVQVINVNGATDAKKDAVTFFVEPQIVKIAPKHFKVNEETRMIILGRYFDQSSTVTIGNVRLKNVQYVSPTLLRIHISPWEVSPERHSLLVTNKYASVQFKDTVDAVDRLVVRVLMRLNSEETETLSWLNPISHVEEIKTPSVLAVLMHIKDPELQPWQNTKKQENQTPSGENPFKQEWVIATVMLPPESLEFGLRGKYLYEKRVLGIGSEINIQIEGRTVRAVVTSDPVSLAAYNPELYHRR